MKNTSAAASTESTSARFVARKKHIVFFMLENIRLPSRTAATIVVKLSSVITMSEAFFVTSVPLLPMAMPISAVFMLGASFTPSPVMATTFPFSFKYETMAFLCRGVTRANTVQRFTTSLHCAGVSPSSSSPEMTCSSLPAMPAFFAMASAVFLWSPVIITVVIPARTHSETALSTPAFNGSVMPHMPR